MFFFVQFRINHSDNQFIPKSKYYILSLAQCSVPSIAHAHRPLYHKATANCHSSLCFRLLIHSLELSHNHVILPPPILRFASCIAVKFASHFTATHNSKSTSDSFALHKLISSSQSAIALNRLPDTNKFNLCGKPQRLFTLDKLVYNFTTY